MKLFTKTFLLAAAICLGSLTGFCQTDNPGHLPTDYLTPAFHAGRRQALRDMMPANSVTVIFSYPERVFSNDVSYVYHPNPDLYYFSGYKEPNAVLLIFKDKQADGDSSYNELFFVRHHDGIREQWTGKRLGPDGAKAQLGFKRVYNSEDFINFPLDFKKFSHVYYDEISDDLSGDGTTGEVRKLVDAFKTKVNIPVVDKQLMADLNVINKRGLIQTLPRIVASLKPKMQLDAYKNSAIIQELVAHPDSATLVDAKAKIMSTYEATSMFNKFTVDLRGIKQPEELAILKKSIEISSLAHAEAMRAVKPKMSERELEGILLYVHKKYGAEDEGYPPIVGAGGNGCVLHYIENTATQVDNQLVLMDVGSEYHGYSADVTRTIPASGKFTNEQRAIYQLVYDAQEAVFKVAKVGTSHAKVEQTAVDVLAAGLVKLGIIKDASEVRKYYPHGCSHHLGLDVHDKGDYAGNLEANMVMTVEPGVYIPAGSACDKKWWNIAVRIEDDIQINKGAPTLLSIDAPRSWQDVEKMAADKSIFDLARFPALK